MTPSPWTVFWYSLKAGMLAWPYPIRQDEYFALPLYLVLPAILIVIVGPALVIHWAWGTRSKDKESR